MTQAWLLALPLLYVGMLFAVAYAGERRLLLQGRPRLRAIVFSLALAVYCSSWTFYGAVGTAARSGLAYVPIYLGPILLFVFAFGVLQRLARVVRQRRITSIADFIGARFGQSHGLAALAAVIAVTAAVPYIALQLKAVASTFSVLAGLGAGGGSVLAQIDSAFWCAVLLAIFAILFSTRNVNATEQHHGLVLAIALESFIKLVVFVAIAGFALWHGPGLAATLELPAMQLRAGLPPGFITETLLAACAMVCLPRQFQIGFVEMEDREHLKLARWLVPAYMAIVIIAVLPIVAAGSVLPAVRDMPADTWVLTLPVALGNQAVALLAFVGGFAAATGMVIVASVALSIMLSNDLVMPALLRIRRLHLDEREDLSRLVIGIRRSAIVAVALMAYAYYRLAGDAEDLAAMGLLAFVAVAQFVPAMLAALYWRNASRRGVICGLAAGFAVWAYTLLVPTFGSDAAWLATGPFGIEWLRPQALFLANGWGPVVNGAVWSLLANAACLGWLSLRHRPSLDERLQADTFIDGDPVVPVAGDWRGPVKVADLRTIAERIVGVPNSRRAFQAWAAQRGRPLAPRADADRPLIQYTERLLASAVGAANARRILIGALSGSGLDVAESMALLDEASQELRFNRELLATTLENVAQGISVVDADMRLVAWNRRYLEFFDYPSGMVYVGVRVAELIRWNAERGECGPGDIDEHVEKRIGYMQAGSPHLFQRVRADGRVLEIRGRPLPGGGYVTTYSDVTEYKRTEHALTEMNATLERRVGERTAALSRALVAAADARRNAESANLSKTRFLAAASHDLLQPLNAARLFTSALRAQRGLDAETARLAERIDASFRAAEGLLGTLLDMSRLDAGSYHPEIAPVSLSDMFASLQAQFALVAAQRGLRLRIAATSLNVTSDPQLLRRIVQNFVSNALRYTGAGGVLIGARRRGPDVRIEVWDTGPGIPAAQRERIFGEFQRLDQPSPWGEKGLGLGLSICDRLARILGHPLSLHSREARGSCFAINAPHTAVLPAAHTQRSDRGAASQALRLTILCLDNDLGTLDGMRALLSRWGADCEVATTAAGARAILTSRPIDLFLTDYHLAGDTDGLQVVGELRNALGELPPVAVITADGSSRLKQRARALGYPLLRKPVRPAALRALLAASMPRATVP